MRQFFLILTLSFSTLLFAQSPATKLIGAWESTFTDGEGRSSQLTMTITDGFMVMTAYNEKSGEFIATLGGRWRADWDNFSITYEFDSSDPTQVSGVSTMPYELIGSTLVFNGDKVWSRTDAMAPGALPGAWEIIGRKRNGEMQDLSERRNSPRKTMKILSGTRFQWISFDIDKKKFNATGGGSYTTDENGMYIEKIEFFSRDPKRSGSQLSFDFSLENGDWAHRGVSSKGQPLHEIWSLRK
jgi:hypothetical protein